MTAEERPGQASPGIRPAKAATLAAALALVLVVVDLVVARAIGWLATTAGVGSCVVWMAVASARRRTEGSRGFSPEMVAAVGVSVLGLVLLAVHAWGIALWFTR